jgi:hypothetical protein
VLLVCLISLVRGVSLAPNRPDARNDFETIMENPMPNAITRLMVVATVVAAALLLVAVMLLARGVAAPGSASRGGILRPAQPVTQTVASVRFSPLGRRWI